MTTLVKIDSPNPEISTMWINPDHIESIIKKSDGRYAIQMGSEDGFLFSQSQLDLLLSACTVISADSPAPAPVATHGGASAPDNATPSPVGAHRDAPSDAPSDGADISARIVRMERAQTSNSKSPMWRCRTDDGIKVNVFQHDDPTRDTFHLFIGTGYEPYMLAMEVGDIVSCHRYPIKVTMRKNGDWWNLISVENRPADYLPDAPEDTPGTPEYTAAQKRAAVADAKIWSAGAVVIDLETTSLDTDQARIIQVAVIDHEGTVLFDSLVNPGVPINDGIETITGIDDDMVKDAPAFAEIAGKLLGLLKDKTVIAYNAEFDRTVFENELGILGRFPRFIPLDFQCAMRTYAHYYGVWNAYRDDFNWFKLSAACANESITIDAPLHSSLGDAQRALALIHKMAADNGDAPSPDALTVDLPVMPDDATDSSSPFMGRGLGGGVKQTDSSQEATPS